MPSRFVPADSAQNKLFIRRKVGFSRQIAATPGKQINAQRPTGHCAFIFTLPQEFSLFFFAVAQSMLFQFV